MSRTEHEEPQSSKNLWSSEPAFVASMAAAAVGLGNLWRFPYLAGENGGGAFIAAYLFSLVVIVLPIMMIEVAAGRLSRGSTVGTFAIAHRFGRYYGWFVVLITMAITSYYLVVTGWTFGYAVEAIGNNLRPFSEFASGFNSLWYFFGVVALATVVLIRGVQAIELFSKLLLPLLLLVIVGLVFAASSTPGWAQTHTFFLDVEWGRLAESDLWLAAFGQACYTLAIGQGYLVTYGSYIPRAANLPRACVIVAVVQVVVAFLASWMIFPFVFSEGLQPDGGSQLAFKVMPRVFDGMDAGYWLGIAFFGLFFVAAFSSVLAGLKVLIAAVEERFGLGNTRTTLAVAALMCVLGIPSALGFTPLDWSINGRPVLEVIDSIVGQEVVITSGVLGAALICWWIPPERIRSVLGTRTAWFEWRMYLVGKYLPVFIIGALIVMSLGGWLS